MTVSLQVVKNVDKSSRNGVLYIYFPQEKLLSTMNNLDMTKFHIFIQRLFAMVNLLSDVSLFPHMFRVKIGQTVQNIVQ